MQNPLSPQESKRHLVVPAGFEPRLFAAEPEIYKPLCMTWDERGRLWIAESTDYPNTKRRDGQGRDRITICEDTDGDGRADSFKVFAEGLNIPTSLLVSDGGVIVLQAPDTLFLKDTDGDGRADVKKVLFTGWGIADTHAGPSNLRWGLDNWVYGIVGYSAFRGTVGGETVRFGQGLYRFKPDGSKLEFLRSTGNNSWGVGFSEEGLVFGSTANGCPSVYLPIPNRYYESVRGWSAVKLESIAASNQFYPVTEQVRQVDYHGGFTAAAGHALYTARTYPAQYWNSTAFVTEPTGHLVATFTLDKKGSDVADYYGWNLLASDDEWTAPIAAEVGPDGNVWVIDWYNYIVQHNPTPHGFRTGRGNAYETPIRDQTHGRIYRVVYKDAPARAQPALDENRSGRSGRGAPKRQPALAAACPATAGRAQANGRRARADQDRERPIRRLDRPERRRDPRALDVAWLGRNRCVSSRSHRGGGRRAQASLGRRPAQRHPGFAPTRPVRECDRLGRSARRRRCSGANGGFPGAGRSTARQMRRPAPSWLHCVAAPPPATPGCPRPPRPRQPGTTCRS